MTSMDGNADRDTASEVNRYGVQRAALRDGLLDVAGTISLLALSLLFIATGGTALMGGGTTIFGIGALIGAFLLAAAAFNVLPFFRRDETGGSRE